MAQSPRQVYFLTHINEFNTIVHTYSTHTVTHLHAVTHFPSYYYKILFQVNILLHISGVHTLLVNNVLCVMYSTANMFT